MRLDQCLRRFSRSNPTRWKIYSTIVTSRIIMNSNVGENMTSLVININDEIAAERITMPPTTFADDQIRRVLFEPVSEQEAADFSEALRLSSERRMRKEARRVESIQRPETSDTLIGFLADEPEIADDIKRLADARRLRAYGL